MFFQSKPVYLIVSCFIFALGYAVQGVAANDEDINALLLQANAGDADAQYLVAKKYYRGEDLARNYQEAMAWYEKAANQDHADAQYQMGYFYRHGLDKVEKNDELAFAWYLKAANLGQTAAQTQVAIMYSQGIGVEQNKALAQQWSNRVMEKKGLIDAASGQSGFVQSADSNAVAGTPELTPEESKAWRYKQARQVVVEADKAATVAGEWADENR